MSYLGLARGLGGRFVLVALLPALSVTIVVAAVVAAGAPGDAPTWSAFSGRLADVSAADAGALLFAVVTVAVILQPVQPHFVRLLEGYWGESRPARRLGAWGKRRQDKRRKRLKDRQELRGVTEPSAAQLDAAARAAAALRDVPDADRLLPTRLGNVLRAAEDRAGDDTASTPSRSGRTCSPSFRPHCAKRSPASATRSTCRPPCAPPGRPGRSCSPRCWRRIRCGCCWRSPRP